MGAKTHYGVSTVTSSHNNGLTGTVVNISAAADTGGNLLLYGLYVKNTTAAAAYVQIFDAAAADVTLGTTTPKLSLGMEASAGRLIWLALPLVFGTRISAASTTTVGGSTNAVQDVDFFYA